MKYTVTSIKTEDDYMWEVYEHATDQVIETFYFEDDAAEAALFFEHGGGFAGFTPFFIVKSVSKNVTNVDDEFTRVFV